jgi:hypothetical protein
MGTKHDYNNLQEIIVQDKKTTEYAIATFSYGERYYSQTNRMIKSFEKLQDKPKIFIVTDKPELISKEDFVSVSHIKEYDEKYVTYNTNYYDFDFSVKRFSVKFALDNGFSKIILTDTDVMPNEKLFTHENILKCFIPNSISGQVTYLFEKEIKTNSMLGKRFIHYEDKFNVQYDKVDMWMPEDCVQFLDINKEKFYSFLSTWGDCVKIKYSDNLLNIPAGNIDEMCFSARHNGIELRNNSHIHINLLIPHHEKWY